MLGNTSVSLGDTIEVTQGTVLQITPRRMHSNHNRFWQPSEDTGVLGLAAVQSDAAAVRGRYQRPYHVNSIPVISDVAAGCHCPTT